MRLLASTYTPKDLNFKGFSFYADFRPEVNEWGKRGEVRCRTILDLRNLNQSGDVGAAAAVGVAGEKVKEEREGGDGDNDVTVSGGGGGSGTGVMVQPAGAIEGKSTRLESDVVKVGKWNELGELGEVEVEGKGKDLSLDFEGRSYETDMKDGAEPDRKKAKVEVDELAEEDEYDQFFDDLGGVDLQHLP